MLNKQSFEIDKYIFTYKPLTLEPARLLYAKLVNFYGGSIASILEAVELVDGFTFESDISELVNPILKGFANGIKDFSLSFDGKWYSDTMTQIILPQLSISKDGKEVDKQHLKGWYEIEFAQKCSVDMQVFLKCLLIQYIDFFERFRGMLNTIEGIKKNINHLHSLKDLIGKNGELLRTSE